MLDCAGTALSRSKRLIDPVVGKERGLGFGRGWPWVSGEERKYAIHGCEAVV